MFLRDSSAWALALAYCSTASKAWLRAAEALFIAMAARRSARTAHGRSQAHFHLARQDPSFFLTLSVNPWLVRPLHICTDRLSVSVSIRAATGWYATSNFAGNEKSLALKIHSLRRIASSWSLSGAEKSDKP